MKKETHRSRGIVLHDFFEIKGGGERLVLTLAKGLGLDLCFGFWTQGSYPQEIALKGIKRVYDLRAYTSIICWRTIKQMLAFRLKTKSFLKHYEIAIYSGVDAPLAVFNHSGRDIFYCHTPPRFIYDQRDFFLKLYSPIWHPFIKLAAVWIRFFYERAVQRMDLIIANSKNVKGRVKRYLGLDSIVIYPPVETEKFCWLGQDDFFLSTARVDPLKRVALVVRAFLKMPDKKLVVISGGSDLPKIKKLAAHAPNIKIFGWVDDKTLRELIGRCLATIYIPRDEDFGISPVESMAAGKPVIGVAEGGLLETIVDGKTGFLLPPEPKEEELCAVVKEMTPKRAFEMRSSCEARARLFDRKVFLEKMKQVLNGL